MLNRARTCLAALGLAATLGGCALQNDAEDTGTAESIAETSEAALTDRTYELSDQEALASRERGDCEIKAGDLIFQRSQSEQAGAIAYLTASELTHVGVVFEIAGAWQVYEAVGPVKLTPLDAWIRRGKGGEFATSRYRDGLTANAVKELFKAGKAFYGKPYDVLFSQDEANIYCSELALKMYERTSVYWISAAWSLQFAGLWKRVDRLDGWGAFEADLAKANDSSQEKLVKRIMAARGIDVHAFASQVLVAPVDLSDAHKSGGVFQQRCELAAHE